MRSKARAFVAAALVAAVCGPFAGIAGADPSEPAPPGPPPAAPQTAMDHDGTYAVGTDIMPGTYSSAGPVADGTCYWKRTSSAGDVIDNALSKKAQVVQIDASDKSFKTNGCQAWQLTQDAVAPGAAPPLVAGAQLGGLLNMINNGARQAGAAPPPHP